jgi:hypothetical protein
MNPAEVVVGEVQGQHRSQVFHFLEKAFVKRVRRRTEVRMLRLPRSTIEVQIRCDSGLPIITFVTVSTTSGQQSLIAHYPRPGDDDNLCVCRLLSRNHLTVCENKC